MSAAFATSALLLAIVAPGGARSVLTASATTSGIAGLRQVPAHAMAHAADADPADRLFHGVSLLQAGGAATTSS